MKQNQPNKIDIHIWAAPRPIDDGLDDVDLHLVWRESSFLKGNSIPFLPNG